MIDAVLEVVGVGLLGLGLLLATIALIGLLRLPDENLLGQLHASGLLTGPAVMTVLLAAVGTGSAEIMTSAVLVFAFLLVTAPLSGHAIARAAHRRDDEDEGRGAEHAGRR